MLLIRKPQLGKPSLQLVAAFIFQDILLKFLDDLECLHEELFTEQLIHFAEELLLIVAQFNKMLVVHCQAVIVLWLQIIFGIRIHFDDCFDFVLILSAKQVGIIDGGFCSIVVVPVLLDQLIVSLILGVAGVLGIAEI